MSVTASEIETEIIRLARVYNPPKGLPSEIAKVWAEVLTDISGDEFRSGVRAYMRGQGKYFPKPSDIRELVGASRRPVTQNNDDPDRCNVCGAMVGTLPEHPGVPDGSVGRIGILHDVPSHQRAGVPHSGYPFAREDVAMYNAYREERLQAREAWEARRPPRPPQLETQADDAA